MECVAVLCCAAGSRCVEEVIGRATQRHSSHTAARRTSQVRTVLTHPIILNCTEADSGHVSVCLYVRMSAC